ncbi:hypothetical protein BDD12DRAFT_402399 [Trichophaea hybrida]|nr:hypothetical protein BDD12DRAFT_402399 [Trichophaea hybrida]
MAEETYFFAIPHPRRGVDSFQPHTSSHSNATNPTTPHHAIHVYKQITNRGVLNQQKRNHTPRKSAGKGREGKGRHQIEITVSS